MKEHLVGLPLLCRTEPNDTLFLNVAVSDSAVSSIMIKEGKQRPVYCVSHALTRAENNYPKVEKVAFTVITTARKLCPYFQANVIIVLIDQPLKYTLQ